MHYANEVVPAQSQAKCELEPDNLTDLLQQANHILYAVTKHRNGNGSILHVALYTIADNHPINVTSTVAHCLRSELSVDNAIILIGSDDLKVCRLVRRLSDKLFNDPDLLRHYVL